MRRKRRWLEAAVKIEEMLACLSSAAQSDRDPEIMYFVAEIC